MSAETKANEKLKAKYFTIIKSCLEGREEEVMKVGSAELAFPVVDENENEKFIVVTVKVPKGSRDGEPYDGYSMAEDYAMKEESNKRKKAEKEKAKKEKIERDKKYREKMKENKERAVSAS